MFESFIKIEPNRFEKKIRKNLRDLLSFFVLLVYQYIDKWGTLPRHVNTPEYSPLKPNEIISLTPATTGSRMNKVSNIIISSFIAGRNLRLEYKKQSEETSLLESLYRERENVPEPNRDEDWTNWMLDCRKNLNKKQMAVDSVRADIDIIEQIVDRVQREIIEISQYHQNSWNYTQVVMDMIEAGRKDPLHERWS